jgi:hypothetical protein
MGCYLCLMEIQTIMGPIVGHDNDGDSHWHQLMLVDYTLQRCLQLKIKWSRWLMFAILDETHDAWGFMTNTICTMVKNL